MTDTDVQTASVSDIAKAMLADPLKRIDVINDHVRTAMAALSPKHFPPSGDITKEEFAKRIAAYEAAITDLKAIVILLARWGNSEHLLLLRKFFLALRKSTRAMAARPFGCA